MFFYIFDKRSIYQVFPSIDDLKKKKIRLDRPIQLPVLRNMKALKAGDELLTKIAKKAPKTVGEPLRMVPNKRMKKTS